MIKEFQGKYRFLSNFWPSKIMIGRDEFKTVEHAYQASKLLFMSDYSPTMVEAFKSIQNQETPGGAKKEIKKYSFQSEALKSDWDNEIRLVVMQYLLELKFQIPELKQKLIDTGDEELQEGNMWHDTFWGVDLRTGKGENRLGKLLMKVREKENDKKKT